MRVVRDPKSWNARSILKYCVIKPAKPLPAVFVGLLLNILDGLSYGLILFPTAYPIFAKTAPDGISIFFVSCIVSQLIYSLGGSIFKGAVGSEMIEVVPFFHKMAILIMNQMGEDHPAAILSTVITSYAISSIITGAIFFVLGILKLGNLVNFFPRSITAGCIGGVGLFLILTGIEVSAQLEGDFEFSKETFQELFQGETIAQWIIPIALAVLLIVIRARWHSTFVLPAYIIAVIAIFYIIFMGIVHRDMTALRETTWVFQKPETGVPFYNFYSYYRFDLVGWGAIAKTLPTMFALSFFGIIHVPINVPALGMFTREDDVDLNREFIAHGVSNALSGAVGSIQNYLVYANSVLFIENGGNSRLAGIELAIATTAIWMVGPGPIGYIPVMVVGILIYMLGIELMSEALWDTFGKVHKLEYLMIVIVVFVMGIYDFVVGIAVGIILACAIYVVQTAQKSAIRGSYSGEIAESTVRRHPVHRQFLHQAGRQIYLTKLAGYLFFGSVVAVENRIRQLIDEKSFSSRPIRYLIFDFSHVTGIDYSAAESFNTMNRILRRKDVEMVLSSVATSDDIGRSFTMVGLLDEETGGNEAPPPKVFEDLNGALEHCENELLMAAKMRADMAAHKEQQSQPHNIPTSNQNGQPFNFDGSFNSPRRQLIHQAATHTFNQPGTTFNEHNIITPTGWRSLPQPLLLILQTFRGLSDKDLDFWSRVVPFFEKRTLKAGDVLYRRGDVPDGFYLLESGLIHVEYELEQGHYYETIVPGTTFGELPFFGDTDRTGTVACERDCVVWCLTRERWGGLQRDERTADVALELLKIGFKLTSERMNAITSYVLLALA
ncbi:sulfate transporter family-domain-containing protein [Lineolata rhizophorae]|uniref:Sulfate transporter family-domain-containing protein n=1 Tax=Lineolata rhizophorae TaxID=578093 RepID=A0A6A6PAV8_9PEZI|nr:sulfate transporter family-domain-containing protein [Lineolata rhizophorae]